MENNELYSEEHIREWHKYFYPNSEVFINKLNIKDYDELKTAEAEYSFKRLVELGINPINGNFDKEHLLAIHKYLFQDLYDWAGKYRTVYMKKNKSYFAEVRNIDAYLDDAFDLMSKEIPKINNYDEFIRFIARYFVILLNIHPFRDGNGRTIKEFFSEFVQVKSKEILGTHYSLDWSKVDQEKLDEAMIFARLFKGAIEEQIIKAMINIEEIELKNKV